MKSLIFTRVLLIKEFERASENMKQVIVIFNAIFRLYGKSEISI